MTIYGGKCLKIIKISHAVGFPRKTSTEKSTLSKQTENKRREISLCSFIFHLFSFFTIFVK